MLLLNETVDMPIVYETQSIFYWEKFWDYIAQTEN